MTMVIITMVIYGRGCCGQARASACSRSAQSTSPFSSPTDSRSSPCGQRSPSQRYRDSSFEWTPPRLVAFTIVVVAVSTRRAAVAVGDVEGDQEAEARIADGRHGRVAGEAIDEDARGRLHPVEPHLERLQAAFEEPRRIGRGDDARQPARQVEPVVQRVVA